VCSIVTWIFNLLTDDLDNGCTFRGGTFSGKPFEDFGVVPTPLIPTPVNQYDFGHIAMTYVVSELFEHPQGQPHGTFELHALR